ncbi:AI-2E family transporter [Phytohabitans houttuyneae]|uniref:AI-2E family transporter n=1 Tax=Phytohabitans houttuyneae TaxID=1076126 RepID=A0A6V8K9B2_9ACTN|nr:AI-2E family transporter [Phytohabitans houttuyneae]GFJ78347.1 AI-2E family transporter [Phytohabitans houttuyneae]
MAAEASGDKPAEERAVEPEPAPDRPAGEAAEAPDDDAPVPPPTGRFGPLGRPLGRNAFVTGFVGGLGVLLAYAAYIAVRNAAGVLLLIFIALFLAVGLNPAVVRLRRWGVPHGLAVGTVALGIILLFCGGLFALVPPVVNESTQVIDNLPGYVDQLNDNPTIRDLNERYDIIQRASSAVTAENITRALGGVLGGASLVFGTVFRVLTVLVLTIYFMAAFDRIKEGAYQLVPASRRQRVRLITDEILTKVGAYMVGALAVALLAGTSTYVFLIITGVAYPFALAVVVAVCDLIPQIGATLGAIVVSIVGFASSLTVGIACVVFFIIYQQVENYLIYPKVMRRSVEVSDVAAIVAALLGAALFGVIGTLVAIPAVAAIQLILREVVVPRQQER